MIIVTDSTFGGDAMKRALRYFACLALLCFGCKSQGIEKTPKVEHVAQTNAAVISEIRVAGNRRIPTETIKAQVRTQPGELFSEPTIKADIDRLRGLGEFDDVRIQDAIAPNGGRILTFQVYEKLPSH